jgi:hypothetical protein
MNQTESYIVLKPIAERFSRIANELTDAEIKSIITSEMRNQLKQIDFRYTVQGFIEEYLEDHAEDIVGMYKSELKNKFK